MDKKVVFSDYPTNKYAKKVDWWTSPEGIELIKGWRQCGCTYKEITEHMGVDIRTFRSWRKKYPELEEALVIGMEITNTRVVNALYKKAVGFYEKAATTSTKLATLADEPSVINSQPLSFLTSKPATNAV